MPEQQADAIIAFFVSTRFSGTTDLNTQRRLAESSWPDGASRRYWHYDGDLPLGADRAARPAFAFGDRYLPGGGVG